MLRNYVKITLRDIKKYKGYSFINIAGLAVGLFCCILILLWVYDERSYDRFHDNSDQIYRVTLLDPNVGLDKAVAVTPLPLVPALKREIPEITYASRISPSSMEFQYQDSRFEERGLLVSSDFLNIFSFPFVQGNPDQALTNLDRIVISEEMAKKIFGNDDPMGQTLKSQRGDEFTVTGVIKDIPHQSHLQFEFLINFRYLEQKGMDFNRWSNISFFTYVMLEKNVSVQEVNQKITECHNSHIPDLKVIYKLQLLKHIYLGPVYMFDIALHGNRQSVIAFSLIAAAILAMACINFINLSTARSSRRIIEVALRKVVGANRIMLIRRFMAESMLMTIIATMLAFGALVLFLPVFNTLSGKQLTLAALMNKQMLFSILGMVAFAGLASGAYPSFHLSSLLPVKALKGTSKMSTRSSFLRKMLIIFQYSITIAVIIGVLAAEKQLSFMRNKDLGYDKTQLLVVPMKREMPRQHETLKQRLLQIPNVASAAATSNLPTHLQSASLVDEWEGKSIEGGVHLKILWVDQDYLKTFDMEMAEGRYFSKERASDQSGFILNQAAIKEMGMESPIGKRAVINDTEGPIIGVVKDFHFRSLHHVIEPMVFIFEPSLFYRMVIKLKPHALKTSETLQNIEALWKEFAPDQQFNYSFLDDELNRLYQSEQLMGTLFRYFSGLTIFIACLGLLGLVSFKAEQRTKEIGIRKVLGATVPGIVWLLSKEFTKWILISNIIAWPIAYYAMHEWLQSFAYRTNLGIGIFILSGLAAFVIALLTVSYQSIKSALADPVDSLRYE